jgi:pimeloyl-ACP methyl ester carboxylesterase
MIGVSCAGGAAVSELTQIRFCKGRDGVRIAYSTMGTGPPLVKAAHFLTHLEHDLRTPVWRPWLEQLSQDRTLVRYDAPGCGLSDREITTDRAPYSRDPSKMVVIRVVADRVE